ncbi:hypothetical protein SJI19_22435, partial [Acerihabitans sp. TG2]|uniref:hypothetical protein n=1 Tax=Acerihabitans sp. TG2 TaxID=3096008 RepID=UPI002B2356A4
MEATVVIQGNPSIPGSMCIVDDPTGKFSAASGIPVCDVSNTAGGGHVATGQASARETTQEVPIDLKSSELILQSKRLVIEAALANLKVTATESARLDAQQQQVKRLIEGQKFTTDNLKASMERNSALQRDMQNRIQQTFIKQQKFTTDGIANRNKSTAVFNAQFANIKASMQNAGDLINASRAEEQARKKAEQHRQEYERQMQDMAREKEEHDRQLAELRRQEEEYKRQLDAHDAKHPLAAAARKAQETSESIIIAERNKNQTENQVREKEQHINSLNDNFNKINSIFIEAANRPRRIGGRGFKQLSINSSPHRDLNGWKKHLSQMKDEINRANDELNHLKAHLDHCHQQIQQAHHHKNEAEAHFNHLRDKQYCEQEAERQRLAVLETELNKQLNEINKAEATAKLSTLLIAAHSTSINENIPLLTDKISFLSTIQQVLKKNEIATCDTLACETGVDGNGRFKEASQAIAIAATTTLAPSASLVEGSKVLANVNRLAYLKAGPMALAGATLFYSKSIGISSDKVPGGKQFKHT